MYQKASNKILLMSLKSHKILISLYVNNLSIVNTHIFCQAYSISLFLFPEFSYHMHLKCYTCLAQFSLINNLKLDTTCTCTCTCTYMYYRVVYSQIHIKCSQFILSQSCPIVSMDKRTTPFLH